jgi:hypothetical protein
MLLRWRGWPSAFGAGGDAGESFVDGIRGPVGGQVDVPSGRELDVRQVDGGFVGPAARPETGWPDPGQHPHQVAASGGDRFDDLAGAHVRRRCQRAIVNSWLGHGQPRMLDLQGVQAVVDDPQDPVAGEIHSEAPVDRRAIAGLHALVRTGCRLTHT